MAAWKKFALPSMGFAQAAFGSADHCDSAPCFRFLAF